MALLVDRPEPVLEETDPLAEGQPSRKKKRNYDAIAAFAVSFVVYSIVAYLLDFKYHIFEGDAISRMANGFYVIFSRDPHLAAIGFVWNPLPSIAVIPILFFKDLWPAITANNAAGSLVSILCMSGSVYQVTRILKDWGVNTFPRLLLVIIFAVNPMILYYSGNGMSEAMYIFTLVCTTRYLIRWTTDGDSRTLVYAASWMGLAYLARNEAAGSAVLTGLLVFAVSFVSSQGKVRRAKISGALADFVIYILPVFTSFVGWATASYVIVGAPFEQFSSQYGNSSQIAVSGVANTTFSVRFHHVVESFEYIAPLLGLIVLILGIMALLGKTDLRALAPVAALGGGVGFSLATYLDDKVFPWYRFYILLIPIEVLLTGAVIVAIAQPSRVLGSGSPSADDGGWLGKRRFAPVRPGWFFSVIAGIVALVLAGVSVPSSGAGMFNPKIGIEEDTFLGYLFHPHRPGTSNSSAQAYAAVGRMTDYFNDMHIKDGDIVVDDFTGCIPNVITRVNNPKIFVIPNDRDFQRVLADPLTFGTHYIVVPQPSGLGSLEEVNKTYPSLFYNGDGFSKFVHQFNSDGYCPEIRLFKVTGHPGLNNG